MSSKQKDTKINLQIELMKEVEENFKFFAKEVDQVDIKEKSQNITIKNIAKDQNERLEERLEKRKKRLRKKSV